MTVLGKINKDFLLYNGIKLLWGLGLFKNWKTYWRCLQTISMTQSYYEPIQYDLDGKLYWRKLLLSLSDMSSIKSYSNIPHNQSQALTI
jgi:hypothetical protein